MSIYIITGKLGGGKSISAVGRIQEYLRQGRRVATNLDLFLEYLLPSSCIDSQVIRVPAKPSIFDLQAIGKGSDVQYDESRYGLLVLDECGTWFNSRGWNDPLRRPVIDWFLHARKLRWDVILIVQDIELLDKQAREALAEHTVFCRRLDRMRVPLIGGPLKALSAYLAKYIGKDIGRGSGGVRRFSGSRNVAPCVAERELIVPADSDAFYFIARSFEVLTGRPFVRRFESGGSRPVIWLSSY